MATAPDSRASGGSSQWRVGGAGAGSTWPRLRPRPRLPAPPLQTRPCRPSSASRSVGRAWRRSPACGGTRTSGALARPRPPPRESREEARRGLARGFGGTGSPDGEKPRPMLATTRAEADTAAASAPLCDLGRVFSVGSAGCAGSYGASGRAYREPKGQEGQCRRGRSWLWKNM